MTEVDEAGFTLIEALVALALGVAVVAVVLSTLHIASTGATRAVTVAAEAEAFARAGSVLAGDAQHGLLVRDASGAAQFQGHPRSLTFPAMARFHPGERIILRFDLSADGAGSDLMRTEQVLLAQGASGPATAPQPIWRGAGVWEFRYLGPDGSWLREWTQLDPPRAFGLVSVAAPQAVELVAAFPDLIEAACALGPGPDCRLDPVIFP